MTGTAHFQQTAVKDRGRRAMSRIISPRLSIRENGLLFNLLNQECNVLACGIVQLVIADPPKERKWKIYSSGVACLLQDKTKHSTFIRLYCLKKAKMLWEQELYTPFVYKEACPFFHTFSGDECQAGLNFAEEEDAKEFYTAVQKQISDSKAHPVLARSYSVSGLKEKLENCLGLGDSKEFKRQPLSGESEPPHHVDSEETLPEINPAVSHTMPSQACDSSQTLYSDEDTVSLAKRKGPLPLIPLHARAAMVKLKLQSGMMQNSVSSTLSASLPGVPPPPAFTAPKVPPTVLKKSASFAPVKDFSSGAVKRFQSFHVYADMQGESSSGNYQ
nr:uncharacterized protein si:dkey-197j19.6 [Misgurnus anguillicaudatus]